MMELRKKKNKIEIEMNYANLGYKLCLMWGKKHRL